MKAMPPLPKPEIIDYNGKVIFPDRYSIAQLTKYANDAIDLEREACASVLELMAEALLEQSGDDILNDFLRKVVAELGFNEAAKVIRARKEK